MKTYTAVELAEIIAKHQSWLNDEEGGERANLSYANLSSANLSYASLRSANLSYARSIQAVTGNLQEIKAIQCDYWPVSYTATHMQIGCQLHEIAEWWSFDEKEISRMDSNATVWWAIWKPILKIIIEASPAAPGATKAEQE